MLLTYRRQVGGEKSPFRGLLPFGQQHSDFFFGRDPEIVAFLESIRDQPVLPVVGPSGAGKSSFLQAGVIPRLREQGAWTVFQLRPGSQPFAALAARVERGETGRVDSSSATASKLLTANLRPEAAKASAALDSGDEDEWRAASEVAPAQKEVVPLEKRLAANPRLLNLLLHDLAERERCKVLLLVGCDRCSLVPVDGGETRASAIPDVDVSRSDGHDKAPEGAQAVLGLWF
ncbi:MAG: hypothetical protein V2A73_22245, partial [Pseudomonadota bacterium]